MTPKKQSFFFNAVSAVAQSCLTLYETRQASLSNTNSASLPKLSLSSQWCHPTMSFSVVPFSSCLQIFSCIRVFFNELAFCTRWPKYWNFNFSIIPSADYSGLISFSINWPNLLSVQGTLKSLLQHHNISINFSVLSLLYGPPLVSVHDYWKARALTRWTFVGKVMSFLVHMLSRFIITFLPRSKHPLISWLQLPSAVILEHKKRKSATVSILPILLTWSDGTRCHDLSFWMLSFKPVFSLSSFTFFKRLFNSSSISVIRVVSSAYQRL